MYAFQQHSFQAQILPRKCIRRTLGLTFSQGPSMLRLQILRYAGGTCPSFPQLTIAKGLFPAHKQGGRLRKEMPNREKKELPCLENGNSSNKLSGASSDEQHRGIKFLCPSKIINNSPGYYWTKFLRKQISSRSKAPTRLLTTSHLYGEDHLFFIFFYRNSSGLHTAHLAPKAPLLGSAALWKSRFTTTIYCRDKTGFPNHIINVLSVFFLIDFFGLTN